MLKKKGKEVLNVIANWNAVHSQKENVILNPVLWETHSWPKLGDRPQAILNEQIVNGCDILIGFFWTRIGRSTGFENIWDSRGNKKILESKKTNLIILFNASNYSRFNQ